MTLTTERLHEIVERRSPSLRWGEAEQIAAELLAYREAVPVAIVEPSDYVTAAQLVGEGPARKSVHELYEGALVIGQHLYTAPPAPAVPDAITSANAPEVFEMAAIVERLGLRGAYGAYAAGYNACRAAILAQPVSSGYKLPDGFCIMPLTLTAANGAKGALSGEFKVSRTVRCHECGGEGCDDCGDAGEFEEETTVPWDTIKDIYRAAVETCSAAMPKATQE
ncbi:TPA: hypothetical protein ACG0BA_000292 [Serratia odorifera]